MSAKQYFFNALIFDYLDFLKNIKGLSENTAKAYQRDLSKFSKFLESIAINSLENIK
jgi:site-specific recombinase XerD